jgi:hypothetical protein
MLLYTSVKSIVLAAGSSMNCSAIFLFPQRWFAVSLYSSLLCLYSLIIVDWNFLIIMSRDFL